MIQTLSNMWRIKELRNKILFTLAMLAIYRLGTFVPVPGVDIEALARMLKERSEMRGLTLLEPVLILSMGFIIAVIIIAILMGILSVNDLAI